MQVAIERHTDARHLNTILNDPDVYPWVKGENKGKLDFAPYLEHPEISKDFYVLLGEYGGQIFQRLQPGQFEVHSQFTKRGRGEWSLEATRKALHWMFTRTEAVEIMTKCPKGNPAAAALAKAIGGEFEFVNPRGWVLDGKPVPVDVYSLSIQDWIRNAPGLVEKGQWFHKRLDAELAKHGVKDQSHPDDLVHDRHVGAAVSMFFGGQPLKGAIFYNRFATLGGYVPIQITQFEPLAVDIGTTILVMGENDFVAMPPKPAESQAATH